MNTEAPGRHKCSCSFKLIPCGQKQFRYSPGFFSQKLNSLLISLSFWRYSCSSLNPSPPTLVTGFDISSGAGSGASNSIDIICRWDTYLTFFISSPLETMSVAINTETHPTRGGTCTQQWSYIYIHERAVSKQLVWGTCPHFSSTTHMLKQLK